MLFAGNKFPISVEPTVLPEGVAKDVSFDPKEPEELRGKSEQTSPYGFEGDGKDFPKGATEKTLLENLEFASSRKTRGYRKFKRGCW